MPESYRASGLERHGNRRGRGGSRSRRLVGHTAPPLRK